jgi:hypothetical protein
MDISLELLMAVELFQAEYTCDRIDSSNGRRNGQLLHVFPAFLVPPRAMPPTITVDAHLSLENAISSIIDRLEIGWLRDVQTAGCSWLRTIWGCWCVAFFEFPSFDLLSRDVLSGLSFKVNRA